MKIHLLQHVMSTWRIYWIIEDINRDFFWTVSWHEGQDVLLHVWHACMCMHFGRKEKEGKKYLAPTPVYGDK